MVSLRLGEATLREGGEALPVVVAELHCIALHIAIRGLRDERGCVLRGKLWCEVQCRDRSLGG